MTRTFIFHLPADLHDVFQVLLRIRLLRHQLGGLKVGLDEQVSVSGGVPVGPGDLHQAVAQQQHQQEQAPGVGRRDADGLQLVPESQQGAKPRGSHGKTTVLLWEEPTCCEVS